MKSIIASTLLSLLIVPTSLWASEDVILLKKTDLWGHNSTRHGGEVTDAVYDDKGRCMMFHIEPAFMQTQSSYETREEINSVNCRPYRIASVIKEQLGQCVAKNVKLRKSEKENVIGTKTDKYVELVLSENCNCSKVTYKDIRYSTLVSVIIAPINSLFNGPEYNRVSEAISIDAEACASLFDSEEEKEIVRSAYQTAQ